LAEGIRRHRANLRNAAAILSLFVIEEVEDPVAHDLAAGGTAELVPNQWLPWHSGLVVEPRVSGRSGIAVVFIQRAMELICPALRHQRNLSAGRSPLVGAFSSHGHAEFWTESSGIGTPH